MPTVAILTPLAILSPDRTASEHPMDALLAELHCSRHGFSTPGLLRLLSPIAPK